ncbi:MAG: hypothetical protein WAK69_00385, partial [Rhodoplanes sp.]
PLLTSRRVVLVPVRPGIGADDPAPRAHHARPDAGTGTSSPHWSIDSTASWWQRSQVTESDLTPFARLLPSVMGREGGGSRVLMATV